MFPLASQLNVQIKRLTKVNVGKTFNGTSCVYFKYLDETFDLKLRYFFIQVRSVEGGYCCCRYCSFFKILSGDKKKRGYWVRPSLARRQLYNLNHLMDDLIRDDTDPTTNELNETVYSYFKNFSRMSKTSKKMLTAFMSNPYIAYSWYG